MNLRPLTARIYQNQPLFMVPLNYNFNVTHMDMHGAMQYFMWKILFPLVEIKTYTRREMVSCMAFTHEFT